MLNPNIHILDNKRKIHSKASEQYFAVRFVYPNTSWEGWIPVEYRRTGLSIETQEELEKHLNYAYNEMNPTKYADWQNNQAKFWSTKNMRVTKTFFDKLSENNDFSWNCVECTLPQNPNWARRIQDLKEMGYTLSTDTRRYCPHCDANKTHIMLLPLPRGGKGSGYETWTPALRKRIIGVLHRLDVFENALSQHCLPDHKFPEIRWGHNTIAENPDTMTDKEIYVKFQLLTNQRNLQKREVCRACYQTGQRGNFCGVNYYYAGGKTWDANIPAVGKEAEQGCVGCPWYDFAEWRRNLNLFLRTAKQENDLH